MIKFTTDNISHKSCLELKLKNMKNSYFTHIHFFWWGGFFTTRLAQKMTKLSIFEGIPFCTLIL